MAVRTEHGVPQPVELDPNYCCDVCHEVLLDPVTLSCGHALDQDCLRKLASGNSGQRACPTCWRALPRNLPDVTFQLREMVQQRYPQQVESRRQRRRTEAANASAVHANTGADGRIGASSLQEMERLRAVRQCEDALARAQRDLERARITDDPAVLREVGLEAVRTASRDTLAAMAVRAAVLDGLDVNMREAAAGEVPGQSWLFIAARDGMLETVRALLEAGADVDHADNFGHTALQVAAECGHMEVIFALLAAGAAVNHTDVAGITALSAAAENGREDAVRVLLEAGATVNHANADGWTALHLAADEGHVEAIVVLVQAGAELNRATDDGLTPLAAARANNHQAAAHALMRAGAAH